MTIEQTTSDTQDMGVADSALDEPMSDGVREFVARYRLDGECDECAIEAAALATGYPDGVREACGNKGCRFYDVRYDEGGGA